MVQVGNYGADISVADKYNTSRDLHQRRKRALPATPPTWDILQTLFGFSFTIQQEILKLRLEKSALEKAQPAVATVASGYPQALGRIVLGAQNLTEASGAAIALGNEQSMVCVARSGVYAPPLGSQFDARSGLSGECIRTRDSVICMNSAADPRVDYNACMALGVRSMVYLPLLNQDRVAGVLAVFSSRPQHFSHRDLNCLRWTDQLISEALQTEGTSQVGAGTLVRTIEFAEPEPSDGDQSTEIIQTASRTPTQPHIDVVARISPPAVTRAPETPKPNIAPAPAIPASAISAPSESKLAPTFVGTIVDETFVDDSTVDETSEDAFFSAPESDPKLAPRFNRGGDFDSPIPILVAMLLVVAFLGAVSLMTYKRLTSAVTPAPTTPVSTTNAAPKQTGTDGQSPAAPAPESTSPTAAALQTTPGFPAGVDFQSQANHAILGIAVSKPVTYEGFAIQGPNRIYFDVHGISLVGKKGISVDVNDELVSRVRISVFRAGTTRIVFDLKGDGAFGVKVSESSNRIAIDISPKNASEPGAISPKAGEAVKITSSGNQVLHMPALPPYAAK